MTEGVVRMSHREGIARAAVVPPVGVPAPVAEPSREYAHVPVGFIAGSSTLIVTTNATTPNRAYAIDRRTADRPSRRRRHAIASPAMKTVSPRSSLTRTSGASHAMHAPQRRSTKATPPKANSGTATQTS